MSFGDTLQSCAGIETCLSHDSIEISVDDAALERLIRVAVPCSSSVVKIDLVFVVPNATARDLSLAAFSNSAFRAFDKSCCSVKV
jgi:hypothetical protein